MILDSSLRIEIVLSGAITTNQLEAYVSYVDYNQQGALTKPGYFRTTSNSTTDVTVLAEPSNPFVREVLALVIYNKDTVNATVTVKTDNSSTERILIKHTLATTESLCWDKYSGWYVI